jgi:hypothetical protein
MELLIRNGIQRSKNAVVGEGLGESPNAGRYPALLTSAAFFFGRSKRQATTAKTVKSPVAKKDVSPQTPVGILNLIEVSDNFYWCVG